MPTPTLVKIDVEGSELRVLRGAEKLLTKSTATKICIEIHSDEHLKKNNFEYNNKDIINQLKYFGFNNFRKIGSMNFFFEKT